MGDHLTIITLTPDELKQIISDAMDMTIDKIKEEVAKANDIPRDDAVIGVQEICRIMGIGRTRFEHYKDELITAGMFRVSKRGSFRMKRDDLDKWLLSKQKK